MHTKVSGEQSFLLRDLLRVDRRDRETVTGDV
jgi:hypothetical protein